MKLDRFFLAGGWRGRNLLDASLSMTIPAVVASFMLSAVTALLSVRLLCRALTRLG
jgi:hypothetical protein